MLISLECPRCNREMTDPECDSKWRKIALGNYGGKPAFIWGVCDIHKIWWLIESGVVTQGCWFELPSWLGLLSGYTDAGDSPQDEVRPC